MTRSDVTALATRITPSLEQPGSSIEPLQGIQRQIPSLEKTSDVEFLKDDAYIQRVLPLLDGAVDLPLWLAN
jgi:hypothetical protein